MKNLLPRFRQILARKETQLRCFHKYQSQLEGWLKGELLCFLEAEQLAGRISDLTREARILDGDRRKSVDLRFNECNAARQPVWLELKHWHIGRQNQSYYGASWYFRERHGSGIIGDAEKLANLETQGRRLILVLATENPGYTKWREGIQIFNRKYAPLAVRGLTKPNEYPVHFFLGLLEVVPPAAELRLEKEARKARAC